MSKYKKKKPDSQQSPKAPPSGRGAPLKSGTSMDESRLRITFKSDWHIGEGAGRPGNIDRIVRRYPKDGLPYVPGKSLTGIWRDACEQVANGLDNSVEDGPWQQWVKVLFGGIDHQPEREETPQPRSRHAPQPALLSVRPAFFPEPLRSWLCRQPAIKEALAFVKPGTSLDSFGVTKKDHLRMEEMICTGAILEAEIELNLPKGPERTTALALLWAGARMVERIGGKRRRGAGRCCLEVFQGGLTPQKIKETLNADPILPPTPNGRSDFFFSFQTDTQKCEEIAPATTSAWHRIFLDLDLLLPVVAFDRQVGNVLESHDYLPGSYLLAALTPKLRDLLGGNPFSAVAAGEIRFLNAYPLVKGKRGLPVPMALHYLKEEGGLEKGQTVFNHLHTQPTERPQRKQYRSGYLASNGFEATLATGKMQAVTHAAIDDEQQRPTSRVGGVFTYEALCAGNQLQAEIWISTKHLEKLDKVKVTQLFNGKYRLGKTDKDDYGSVRITATCSVPQSVESCSKTLTLWLASTLLLRDENLRPSTDPRLLQKTLLDYLGSGIKLKPVRAFQGMNRHEGRHQRWGLPRPSLVGFAAGSCFQFEVTGELKNEQLVALQQEGLGNRRAEGFGELIINPPLLAHENILPLVVEEETRVLPTRAESWTDNDLLSFAKQLARRAWRNEIQQRALAKAANLEFRQRTLHWNKENPSNSQLGALRSLLEPLKDLSGLTLLRNWLTHLKETPNREKDWPKQALEAITEALTEPVTCWTHLDTPNDLVDPQLSGLTSIQLKEELQFEALRTLWLAAIQQEFRYRERK